MTIVAEFDLTALAASLKETGSELKLVNLIQRAVSIESAVNDIKAALGCLDLLQSMSRSKETDTPSVDAQFVTIASSLFAHAVVLYARATETDSDHRLGWFDRTALSPTELTMHEMAMALRNDAIAHFGPGDAAPEGALVKEALLLQFGQGKVPKEQIYKFQPYSHRTQYSLGVLKSLKNLCEAALKITASKAEERMQALFEYLVKERHQDSCLWETVSRFPFDSISFFGSVEYRQQLDAILASPNDQTTLFKIERALPS